MIRRRGEGKKTIKALLSPTCRDLEWAAGFLEGEGSFQKTRSTYVVSAPQKEREPLERLQRLFGGRVAIRSVAQSFPQHQWTICGARARGVMMTLYGLMTRRRRIQIQCALGVIDDERRLE